jgi:hypothetical protein
MVLQECTHIISDRGVKRSVNMLAGMSVARYAVTDAWMDECVAQVCVTGPANDYHAISIPWGLLTVVCCALQGRLVDEQKFSIKDPNMEQV